MIQNFTELLLQKGYTVSNDQPAFGLSSGFPYSDEISNLIFKSEVALKLSQKLRDTFFLEPNTKFCNLTPFLKQHSACLFNYFADIDFKLNRSLIPLKNPPFQPVDGFGIILNDPKQGAVDTPFGSMIFPIYNDGELLIQFFSLFFF